MNPLKNNLMVILIITCLLLEHAMCDKNDLIVVTKKKIKFLSNETLKPKMNVKLPDMTAAAFNPTTKEIYVSGECRIWRIQITNNTEYNDISIVSQTKYTAEGLAYDHLNFKLYFTMMYCVYYVEMPKYETQEKLKYYELTCAWETHDIAVDGRRGYVYFLDKYSNNNVIKQYTLKEKDQIWLVERLKEPRSLTVDIETGTVYWTDYFDPYVRFAYCSVIDSFGHGTTTRIITADKWSPLIIAIHDQYMYGIVSLWGKLWVMNKDKSNTTEIFSDVLVDDPIGLFVMSGIDAKETGKK